MQHTEHLRYLRDHQCDDTPLDENEMKGDETVLITLPPMIWFPGMGISIAPQQLIYRASILNRPREVSARIATICQRLG